MCRSMRVRSRRSSLTSPVLMLSPESCDSSTAASPALHEASEPRASSGECTPPNSSLQTSSSHARSRSWRAATSISSSGSTCSRRTRRASTSRRTCSGSKAARSASSLSTSSPRRRASWMRGRLQTMRRGPRRRAQRLALRPSDTRRCSRLATSRGVAIRWGLHLLRQAQVVAGVHQARNLHKRNRGASSRNQTSRRSSDWGRHEKLPSVTWRRQGVTWRLRPRCSLQVDGVCRSDGRMEGM
ncbi:hypothetical protein C8Q70DRAFT_182234 [Cubamyces menziesii]|nr:hypothetical protein C8Q70DRAFT_182234 [Cubamyces menziesii]